MNGLIYTQEEIDKIVDLYNSGLGSVYISRLINKGTLGQVKYVLKKHMPEMRPAYQGRPPHSFPMLLDNKDFIDGLLLGDGCMFPGHYNSGLTVTQKASCREFLVWIQDTLKKYNVSSGIYNSSRTSQVCIFYSHRSIEFTKFRERWYPSGKKCIPPDISMTPRALLCWYLGDGTKHKTNAITLYTNSFSFEDVNRLSNLLSNKFDILNSVHEHKPGKNSWSKHPQTAKPIIYIPVSQAKKAFAIMGKPPVNCFLYKWPD